jgi:heme-degrading monooxygenase HmoA
VLIHCLTVRFKSTASEEQIAAFQSALAELPAQIDVIVSTRQGRDLGDRPTNADYAVVTEFNSAADFYTYLEHPAHKAIAVQAVASMSSVQFVI